LYLAGSMLPVGISVSTILSPLARKKVLKPVPVESPEPHWGEPVKTVSRGDTRARLGDGEAIIEMK
jgi:hypothetical protein